MAGKHDWRYRYDGVPPQDDDNDYEWDRGLKMWVVIACDLSPEEENALERVEQRRRNRAEWDHYHPGEPCPESELT